jgi:hypothetical protein
VKLLLPFLLTALVFAADEKGIRPRPSQDDYPAQRTQDNITVAAALLSRDEVRNTFATGLTPHYFVVEVAVYPGNSGSVNLDPDDFVMRVGNSRALVRPVEARTIAARLHRQSNGEQRPASSPSDITVYPTVGVGVGSGPSYPDGRRAGGVSTGVGVGVGIGGAGQAPPPPASTDADRKTMETELSDKALPEQRITSPVAGYLYFPVAASDKRKQTSYELEYAGAPSKLIMRLPVPREK